MNIFVIHPDPNVCAKALDDLRLNKMIIETAQLLSTAVNECGYSGQYGSVYKSTHKNHPCAVWARESQGNYEWLLCYMNCLVFERIARTGKSHKSASIVSALTKGSHLIPAGPITPFANCTPHKSTGIFDAYKLTLKDKWANDKRPPKWTNAPKPTW